MVIPNSKTMRTNIISIHMNNKPHAQQNFMNDNFDIHHIHLWRLISPSLPVGAFAYSQGLEYAIDAGWICNEDQTRQWLHELLQHNFAYLEVPLFQRLYHAWLQNDLAGVEYWNQYLLASREAAEVRAEDLHLGGALKRLLSEQEVPALSQWPGHSQPGFQAMLTLAAVHWHIPLTTAVNGFAWSWCENQVAAAIKLIPLGQTAGQRILLSLTKTISETVIQGLDVKDEDIGILTPRLAMACALHETQYSRLFRS